MPSPQASGNGEGIPSLTAKTQFSSHGKTESDAASSGTTLSQSKSKAILKRALSQAHLAVLSDSANDFASAIASYTEALRLLRQVLNAVERDEDKRRLEEIYTTYSDRVHLLNQVQSTAEGAMSPTRNSNHPDDNAETNLDPEPPSQIDHTQSKMSQPDTHQEAPGSSAENDKAGKDVISSASLIPPSAKPPPSMELPKAPSKPDTPSSLPIHELAISKVSASDVTSPHSITPSPEARRSTNAHRRSASLQTSFVASPRSFIKSTTSTESNHSGHLDKIPPPVIPLPLPPQPDKVEARAEISDSPVDALELISEQSLKIKKWMAASDNLEKVYAGSSDITEMEPTTMRSRKHLTTFEDQRAEPKGDDRVIGMPTKSASLQTLSTQQLKPNAASRSADSTGPSAVVGGGLIPPPRRASRWHFEHSRKISRQASHDGILTSSLPSSLSMEVNTNAQHMEAGNNVSFPDEEPSNTQGDYFTNKPMTSLGRSPRLPPNEAADDPVADLAVGTPGSIDISPGVDTSEIEGGRIVKEHLMSASYLGLNNMPTEDPPYHRNDTKQPGTFREESNVTVAQPLNGFQLMRTLEKSMTIGAYLTPKLYVPKSLWYQSHVKLPFLEPKLHALQVLTQELLKCEQHTDLNDMATISNYLGNLESITESVATALGRKCGIGSVKIEEDTAKKETSQNRKTQSRLFWGTKLSKSVEKINFSPGNRTDDIVQLYVDMLIRLFRCAQMLEDWMRHFSQQQSSFIHDERHPHPVPDRSMNQAEVIVSKISSIVDTLASVIGGLAVRDLALLLGKWIARRYLCRTQDLFNCLKLHSPSVMAAQTSSTPMKLIKRSQEFYIVRCPPDTHVSEQLANAQWVTISKTLDETSVIVPSNLRSMLPVSKDVKVSETYYLLQIDAVMDFSEVGVLVRIASPFKSAGLPIFVVSTYDTDYIYIRKGDWDKALQVLEKEGHQISYS
ncbi:hypothetical protein BZG36_00364 [Bifiguratus adelaidae]|uniref:CASTOR ACT domain-containing protein n=1 Tax=Bifiguratus adelaidae TaxID=1938954 RepID=A0A261Y7Y9_9FUNG|nr:hypothetical protein BZG36_00364 [Bifiguratus adelaidae]